jgi:hypothetical protein
MFYSDNWGSYKKYLDSDKHKKLECSVCLAALKLFWQVIFDWRDVELHLTKGFY